MSGSEIGLRPRLSQQPDRAWAADSTRTLDSGLLGLLPTARQTTPPRNHAVESYALEAFDLVSGFRSSAPVDYVPGWLHSVWKASRGPDACPYRESCATHWRMSSLNQTGNLANGSRDLIVVVN